MHTSSTSREVARQTVDRLPPDIARGRVFSAAQSAEFVGFSLAHFRQLYRAGKVPKPIQIGERKLGWKVGTLIDWTDGRAARS